MDRPKCRWVSPIATSLDGARTLGQCSHPMVLKFLGNGGGHITIEESCQGCPGHEPQPSVVKDSLTTRPDQKQDTCRWWKDEFRNWYRSCSDIMPGFTPWPGTDPNGSFCPKCGKIITVRVHDKP